MMQKERIIISSLSDMCKYKIPTQMLEDINQRIAHWLAGGGSIEDNYIKQQYKYIENYLNK